MNFLEKWYDAWWWAISERMDPLHPLVSWEPDFFEYINRGWLDMYYEPPTELESKEDFIKSFAYPSIPYYNEKYYDYEV